MSERPKQFTSRPRRFWPIPRGVVEPLVPHLPRNGEYGEPCAGDGRLIDGLAQHWPACRCVWRTDIHPMRSDISQQDALSIPLDAPVSLWITKPPRPSTREKGDQTLSIIAHLCRIAPTWALLPFAFAGSGYYIKIAAQCRIVLPIGRVSWAGNGLIGNDDLAWFLFDAKNKASTVLLPRIVGAP